MWKIQADEVRVVFGMWVVRMSEVASRTDAMLIGLSEGEELRPELVVSWAIGL